jgi:hypothetical protein
MLRKGADPGALGHDPLWTPEQVARRLNVSPDWVRDHSSRKEQRLPVIRLGGGPGRAGLLRYRASKIEEFIEEMERRRNRPTEDIMQPPRQRFPREETMARSHQRGTVRSEYHSWVGYMNVRVFDPTTRESKWKKQRVGCWVRGQR